MISENNLRLVLKRLGFEEKKEVFEKYFSQTEAFLKVDFGKKELIYPEEKGLKVNQRQTCNFEAPENFVVFECVHRLFEKGYLAKHIELEPTWKLGHGASGGRADILVHNQAGKPLLLIECKTAGKEFDKAWKYMQQDGGQLFSYVQQTQETEFMCLYASGFDEKMNEIIVSQQIVSHKDNPDVLEQGKGLKSFEKAKDVKERYEVWKTTYKLESTESGIFEESIQAYQIGKNKYTLDEDTKPLSSIDKKGLYHQFRTILRKHNVSRRENAFDVLVNLFLCKIIDETENKTDLKFRWKGIAYDNYYDLVDRLQGLYQVGMKKFLKEEILYVSNEEIDKAFWTTKTNRNATKKRIKEIFRELKFYKGLDFEFIKVHNSKGFDKNAKILIDIIKMWQSVRLTSQVQNQFLGDMFEFFLDNGIKQTEGQFFTPIPICKFIVASLPLEQKIREKSEPLQVIDYACGSGHFLTEYALAAKPIIEEYKEENAVRQHYGHIFGIEKEDRLAKVATVSACMYGQKEIHIIDTDALGSHESLKKESFDVLVANPPFAVDDFLEVLVQNDEKEANAYELFQNANLGTNNIQCFFLERSRQLLARNGVAGIIVPTSILSNSDTMHVQTREILLKYFDFVSVVELGSGTFGKTGTNTVVLFLRRKEQNPEQAEHFWNRTQDFFENALSEIESNGGVYQDLPILKKYCAHIEVDFEVYQAVLLFERFEMEASLLFEYEVFKEYKTAFEKSTEVVNLHKKTEFKKLSAEQQARKLQKMLWDSIRKTEQEKVFYFMLAHHNPKKVLLVKSPADNAAQKKFLGYEWTNSKGSEGIKYAGGDTVYDIETPLFNPKDRKDGNKISYWIGQNFLENETKEALPEALQGVVMYSSLVDLLDFSRKDFNKALSLTPKKTVSIDTKWELVKIEDFVSLIESGSRPKGGVGNIDEGIWSLGGEHIHATAGTLDLAAPKYVSPDFFEQANRGVLKEHDILICKDGALTGKTALVRKEFDGQKAMINEHLFIVRCDNLTKQKYLFYFLLGEIGQTLLKENITGAAQGGLNSTNLKNIKIPLPPLSVQEKIVQECEAIDRATEMAKSEIEKAKREIEGFANEVYQKYKTVKLGSVSENPQYGANESAIEGNPQKDYRYIRITDIDENGNLNNDWKTAKTVEEKYILEEGDFLFARSGATVGKTFLYKKYLGKALYAGYLIRFRVDKKKLIPDFLKLVTKSAMYKKWVIDTQIGTSQPNINGQMYSDLQIPVPPLAVQVQLVSEIEELEKRIAAHEGIIGESAGAKRGVLKRYL